MPPLHLDALKGAVPISGAGDGSTRRWQPRKQKTQHRQETSMPKMTRIHHQARPTAVGVPLVAVLQRETPPGPKPKLIVPVLLRLLGQSHDATSHSWSCHDSPGASGNGTCSRFLALRAARITRARPQLLVFAG